MLVISNFECHVGKTVEVGATAREVGPSRSINHLIKLSHLHFKFFGRTYSLNFFLR